MINLKPTNLELFLPSGKKIKYLLKRRNRRTIGLKVDHEGLIIHAPILIPRSRIEELIMPKLDWIQEKLSLQLKQKKKISWKTGELIYILGNGIILSFKASKTNSVLQDKDVLHIDTNRLNDQLYSAKLVSRWLKEKAFKDFVRRVEVFSVKLNVHPSNVYLSNAKSRWGSCNTKKEIRLNWRLIQAPPHIINYVICHELAHLKEMNHSNHFWEEIGKVLPEYRSSEKELKTLSNDLYLLG
ncbi:MAG: M48 family peptidase [Candidatus Methylopumilus sp.]|nr:M48 family peptidase [Candidatus Methylopumilus sp.]